MSHVLSTGAWLALLAAALWWAGDTVLVLARVGDLGALRHLARCVVGLAGWGAGLFVLAVVGALHGLGLGLLAAGWIVARWLAGRPWPAFEWPRRGPVDLLLASALGALLGLGFCVTIGPNVFWDAGVYHLTVPKLYLEAGGFRPVPMSVYSNWPLLTELFFAAALMVRDHMLAKAVHFGFGLLVLHALAAAARGELGPRAGRLAWPAIALFLANDVVAFEMRVAYVELAQTFAFLAAFLFLDRALDGNEPRAASFLLLAGVSGGLLAGMKVTGVLSVAVLAVLPLAHLGSVGWRPFLLRFALPAAAGWLPWLLKSAWATGHPFYPFLGDGPDWSPRLGEALRSWQGSIGMGREPLDFLLLPWRVIVDGKVGDYGRFDGELGLVWLVAVPLAIVFARRRLARRALVVSGLAFVVWASTSQQMRFLVPVLPLLALAAADGLVELAGRFGKLGQRWVWTLAVAVSLLAVVRVHGPQMAGGARNLRAFAAFEGDLAATVVPEPLRYVNEHLPDDALLLFLNHNQGFFCDREYLADSFFEASQIADWLGTAASVAQVRRRLDERGVTHVVLDRRPAVAWPEVVVAWLQDPAQLEVLYRSPDRRWVVLRLS